MECSIAILNYLQIDFISVINSSKLNSVDSVIVCSSELIGYVGVGTVYACRTPGVDNTHVFSSEWFCSSTKQIPIKKILN